MSSINGSDDWMMIRQMGFSPGKVPPQQIDHENMYVKCMEFGLINKIIKQALIYNSKTKQG